MNTNEFIQPDFTQEFLQNAPDCQTETVEKDGVAPDHYHAMSIYPEYFKIDGNWVLATESRMDTVAVVRNGSLVMLEFRNLKKGDAVVLGRTEDASEGIYLYTEGFPSTMKESDKFAFRSGRSRETAFSKDYDELYELMRNEKETGGHIVWVVGPSLSYDDRTRKHMAELVKEGYVNAMLASNSTAVVDLARGLPKEENQTAKKRYYVDSIIEYDTVRRIRLHGGIAQSVEKGLVKDGYFKAMVENKVPFVLSPSIRDRYNLEEVIDNVYEAQDQMRAHTRKATMLICLSSVLNTIASGNMTPSYMEKDGKIRPVHIYTVDLQEFSVNNLSDRGSLEVKSLVTNIHDFVENVATALVHRS